MDMGIARVYRIFGTAFGGGDYRQKLARAGRYRYRGGRCGAVSWHIIGQSVRQWQFLYGLIAILIGGSMWGMYIITGRRVAAGGNSLDNLCIAVTIGWLVQSLFLGVPAVAHVVHPKADATWALEPGGSLKLLALLFVISLMASFIPYVVEQITLRRTTSGAFSVMQSINPAMAVAVGLRSARFPALVKSSVWRW